MSHVLNTMNMIGQGPVNIQDLKRRALPAIKHPDTGKLLVGRRGETHEDIGDKHGLSNKERAQSNRGFYDPLTKQYHTKAETGMDSTDLMSPAQKASKIFLRRFGEKYKRKVKEFQSNLGPEVTARVVPALKHPITGQIFTGNRGDSHNDIITKRNLDLSVKKIDGEHRLVGMGTDKWEPGKHTGYYDRMTKTFHPHEEAGFDTTDLMTKQQRFRKYGTESWFHP